ncbi:hypothetical protein [Gymnodinialimonas sp. 57CJ19]|uniref:glycine-rich domain-containing protein n=1 Tax=Gymnodinialimonas sp. 57CJ19 TaxID=3138498 RepID=UPI0031343F1C
MRNPELWTRLQAYQFDGPGSAPFSVKLSRAEGWSRRRTAQVIEEYRKFLYLTQISDRQVTPSRIVDAAWHMHLTFTRDYWDHLCTNVIGKPIHHQPCAGEEEMPRYRDQFAATRALYEAEFGVEPPADIWARDAVPRRKFLQSEAGSFSFQGIAGLLFFVFVVLGFLDLLGGIEGVSGAIYLVLLGLFVVFAWLGFGPRPRRKKDAGAQDGGWYWEWPEFDSHSDGGGGGDSNGDAGGCGGCGD